MREVISETTRPIFPKFSALVDRWKGLINSFCDRSKDVAMATDFTRTSAKLAVLFLIGRAGDRKQIGTSESRLAV